MSAAVSPPPTHDVRPLAPCPVSLLRYTTKDFVSYSAPPLSLYITNAPGGGGTPTVKSLARNDDTVNSPPHPSLPAAPPSHNRTA